MPGQNFIDESHEVLKFLQKRATLDGSRGAGLRRRVVCVSYRRRAFYGFCEGVRPADAARHVECCVGLVRNGCFDI